MRKIYDFSKFSSLYEAETSSGELNVTETEASKLYDQTLGLILTTILNSYSSELSFPINSYDPNIDEDIFSVKASPVLNKPESFIEILQKVQKSSVDNKLEGASEAVDAWVKAGSRATDALTAMINQYKDQPEELKHINDFIDAKLDSFLEEIQIAAEENDLKAEISSANESNSYSGEIFEGFLQGKKGMIEDVSRQITLVNAKLASLAQTPGMGAEIQKLQNEVTQISAKMGDLLSKPNKDINKEDIKKAATRLAEIPGEADKIAEKMLKEDSTNKEASSILVQALALVQDAIDKEKKYLQKKEQAIQREEENISKAREEKIKVRISTDRIDYDADNTKSVNPEVKKFQELVVDKFGKINKISSLPQFKMMGTDGKFGKGTRDMVKILKKGFDLSDTSGDITKELLDEIQVQSDSIKESVNSRVYTFSDFLNVSEAAFNVDSATDYAKSLATYSTPSPSGKSSGYGKVSSGKIFKQGDKGPEVTAIQNAVSAKITGTDEDKNQLFGPVTKQAVMDWQKANGFTGKDVDGIVGPKTLKKMAEMKSLGTWTASMISKLANVEVKPLGKAIATAAKQALSNAEIQSIAKSIIGGTSSPGTDPAMVLGAIKKLKNKKDFDTLDALLKKSSEIGDDEMSHTSKPRHPGMSAEKLGLESNSEYPSVQTMVNGEMGSDNLGTVQDITNHLKSIGVNASFSKLDSGDFKEDSFKIS